MDQRELIQALTERSDGALEQLRLHYGPLIRYIINPILPDERDREEALSDVLLRVWDRIEQYDPDRGSWTGWLGIIARNAAVDRARALPPRSKELTPDIPAPHSDPEQELLRRERKEMLRRAVSSLPAAEQHLFYRKYYYRQTTAQIAAECGAPVRAIEGRLYRIKQKLRKTLGGDFHDG